MLQRSDVIPSPHLSLNAESWQYYQYDQSNAYYQSYPTDFCWSYDYEYDAYGYCQLQFYSNYPILGSCNSPTYSPYSEIPWYPYYSHLDQAASLQATNCYPWSGDAWNGMNLDTENFRQHCWSFGDYGYDLTYSQCNDTADLDSPEEEISWLNQWMTESEDPGLIASLFVKDYDLAASSSWPLHPIIQDSAAEQEEIAQDSSGQDDIIEIAEDTTTPEAQGQMADEDSDTYDSQTEAELLELEEAAEVEIMNAEPQEELQDMNEDEDQEVPQQGICWEPFQEQRTAMRAFLGKPIIHFHSMLLLFTHVVTQL